MKLLASLLCVFVAIAFVGPAAGDSATDVGATECTLVPEEGQSTNETIFDRVEHCFFQIGYEHMGTNPPAELIRTTLTAMCERAPKLRKCLDEFEPEARACLEETQRTKYRLYRQLMELHYLVGCEDNGVDLVEYFRQNMQGENKVLMGCQKNATAQAVEMDAEDTNGFVLHQYKIMVKVVECLEGHRGQGQDSNWAITMYKKVMDRAMCVKDGVDVLCKTIVNEDH